MPRTWRPRPSKNPNRIRELCVLATKLLGMSAPLLVRLIQRCGESTLHSSSTLLSLRLLPPRTPGVRTGGTDR
jgi:hypothetical protein